MESGEWINQNTDGESPICILGLKPSSRYDLALRVPRELNGTADSFSWEARGGEGQVQHFDLPHRPVGLWGAWAGGKSAHGTAAGFWLDGLLPDNKWERAVKGSITFHLNGNGLLRVPLRLPTHTAVRVSIISSNIDRESPICITGSKPSSRRTSVLLRMGTIWL